MDLVSRSAETSPKRTGTANLLSPQRNTFIETTPDTSHVSAQMRTQLLEKLANDPLPSLLRILVLLSAGLKHEDYVRLSPALWERCLLLQDKSSVLNVSIAEYPNATVLISIQGMFPLHAMRREST